jgi:hypothetical protein
MKNSKHVLFIFAFLISAIFLKAQTYPTLYSPEAIFDSTVYDQNGTRYYLNDLKIDTVTVNGSGEKTQLLTSTTCSSTNYFNLYFEPNCGMASLTNTVEITRRNTIFQLFCDVSNFIANKGGISNKINVWIRNPLLVPSLPSYAAAQATSYYSYPYAPAKSGIIDNQLWKTIVSGQDSYVGITTPLISSSSFYHFMITFNYPSALTWNDDMATVPTSTMVDLYTVGLHEIVHALGFQTGIKYNGNSLITFGSNYYTRYDQFLKTQSGTPLIANTGTCSLYAYAFNTATTTINPNTSGCTPPSGVYTNSTNCSTAIWYASNTVTVPVYTSGCYETGVSLSHFEDMCAPIGGPYYGNDQYFVMSGAGNVPMKRYLKEEERKVLCNLGYSVQATYGVSSYTNAQKTYTAGACSGLDVAGINDGLTTSATYNYTTNVNVATATIQPLTNDVGVSGGTYQCLEVVIGSGVLSATGGNITTPFTYSPTTTGLHLLRYVPVSSGGVKGGITYIYVNVLGPNTCSVSLPNNCEMVYNGGFESGSICGHEFYPFLGTDAHYDCWKLASGFFDHYVRNCITANPNYSVTNPPTSYTLPATLAYGPLDTWNGSPTNNQIPFLQETFSGNENVLIGTLTSSLSTGAQYKLSYWVKDILPSPITYSAVPSLTVYVHASPQSVVGPLSASLSPHTPPFTLMSSYVVPRDNQWHNYSAMITYSGSPLSNIAWEVSGGGGYSIDDFSLLPASAACTFTMPAISCTGATYTLNSMVSIPNGTFSGPGVSYSSPNYIFDANTAGNGFQTISYTYTTATGCPLTAYAQTSVTPTPILLTVFANPPAGLCSSYPTATLTATGATTYTFNNGVTSTYTNPATVSPTATTIYTVTGANATCSLSTTYTVNYTTACLCSATNTVASTLNTTTLSSSSGYALQGAVTITGGNVVFSGVDMRCSPGSSITVASGATLTITQSHFYSCFDMWQGIIVQPGGYLKINTSLIEDAVQAVKIDNNTSTTGTVFDTYQTTFNRNYTSIAVSNYTQALSTYPFSIKQAIFTSRDFTFTPTVWPTQGVLSATCAVTNTLATPYCLQNFPVINMKAPNNTTTAYYGITLVGVGATTNPSTTPTYYSFQVGDNSNVTYYNIFDNLLYGISATNSNVKVLYNVFQNSQSMQVHGNWLGGTAITSSSDDYNNNYLAVKATAPFTSTRHNKFFDCTYGIISSNVFEHDLQYSRIYSTQTVSASYQPGKYGIYVTTNRFRKTDLSNNTILNNENAITFNTTYGAINFGASSYTNTQFANAVNINTNNISPVGAGSIGSEFVSNAITVQNVLSTGSTQTVSTGALVNVLSNTMTKVYRGIYGSNFSTPPLFMQNNNATLAIDPGGNLQNGISITANTNPTVQLNSITGPVASNTISTGIYASMNSAPKVTCNTVSSTYQGFEFAGSQAGTKWKGNSMTTHTLGFALTYTGVIGAQGSSTAAIDNAWNNPSFWTGGNYHTWTLNSSANSSTLYVQNTAVYNPTNNAGSPNINSYAFGGVSVATNSYSCVNGGARLMAMTEDEQSYYDALESIAGYVPTKNNIVDPANYIAQYQLYRNIDSDPSSYLSSKILSDFYYNNNNSSYSKLLDAQNNLMNGNYSSAASVLNSIGSKNNIETNYNEFADLYSKYYTKNFVDADNKNLHILANKCPFVEGEVIYQARTLYNIINSTVEVFKDNCPDNNSSRLMNSVKQLNNWDVKIYPNPANNELFFSTNSQKEVLKVSIIDINGRRVADYNLTTNGYLGNIKLDLISGIYFVTLSNATGEKVIKKLVIAK